MADDRERQEPKDRSRKAPDQLSPNQALEESAGGSASQRVGDSGPLANPVVSFPDEPDKDQPDTKD